MKYIKVLVLIFIFSIMIKNVFAGPIVGISPGVLDYKNVLRGGYSQKFIIVTLSSDEEIKVSLEGRGEIANWLNFPKNLTISKSKPARIPIEVSPPFDIPNGNYKGFVSVFTEPLTKPGEEGSATGVVRAELLVAVNVEITDVEIRQCSSGSYRVYSAEKGDDIKFEARITNLGNIRMNPTINVNIWDEEQLEIVKSFAFKGKEILPTHEEGINFSTKSDELEIGQYWAEIKVDDCYSTDILTFDVLEEGALKSEGVLIRIFATPFDVETGQTIPITADFQNIGEKEISAQFKGQIKKDGNIIQVLESEKTSVIKNEITKFTFYFTPKEEGKYVVSGRVFYDKKRTFELSTIINAIQSNFLKKTGMVIIYLAILLIIIILFIKIRNEKKRYLHKLRMIRS